MTRAGILGVVLLPLCLALVAQDPVGLWRFDVAHRERETFLDGEGRRALTVQGPAELGGGGEAEALVLDGTQRLAFASSSKLPSEALTLEAWCVVDDPIEWGGLLCCLEDNGAFERGWILGYHGDRFLFGLASEGAQRLTYLNSDVRLEPGRWHHVAGTYDGARLVLYVDGELAAQSEEQSGPVLYADAHRFVAGAYLDANEHRPMVGRLRELALYDEALSPERVRARHAAVAPLLEAAAEEAWGETEAVEGWPGYLRDDRRSGASDAALTLPLERAWTHEHHAPAPSWGAPARGSHWQKLPELTARVTFDRAHHVAAVGDDVWFASSVDDQVRCLDARTGEVRWTFFAGGPVRLAPRVDGERLFFGSDDGAVYCLDRGSGELLWRTGIAPEDRVVVGNGRLVSAWPVRTGVAVGGGRVFATAGLFPSLGTWAVALDAESGAEVWRTRLEQGVSPQGYLLLSPTRVYVPSGRTTPFALDRDTGRWLGQFGGPGGSYALLTQEALVTGPGNTGELQVAGPATRDVIATFRGEHMVAAGGRSFVLGDGKLQAFERERFVELTREREDLTLASGRVVQALGRAADDTERARLDAELSEVAARLDAVESGLAACFPWTVPCSQADALILAGDALFAGGEGEVAAFSAQDGRALWRGTVEGRALGLAAASGRLFVSTDAGRIVAFGGAPGGPPPVVRMPTVESTGADLYLDELVRALPVERGLALVLDGAQEGVAAELARRTELHVVRLAANAARADALRRDLAARGLYGTRVSVLASTGAEIADHVAAAVVRGGAGDRALANRLVRPGGPVLRRGPVRHSDALAGAGHWTHAFADAGNSAGSGDERVSADLWLQWFGGPGPSAMIDRHLRTAPPLAGHGRLVIPGDDLLIGVDAYSGVVLWERAVPGFSRTGVPYDGGHLCMDEERVYATAGAEVLVLDGNRGDERARHPTPVPGADWGWLARLDDALLGSAQVPGASRRAQSRTDVVEQYRDERPLVCSSAVFALDAETGAERWVHTGGVVPNTTLAAADGAVVFVESAAQAPGGRATMGDLTAAGADLVRLDLATGRERWRTPLENAGVRHVLYLSIADGVVLTCGSFDGEGVVRYSLVARDLSRGRVLWSAQHDNNRGGVGGDHGEQVHHPVIAGGVVFAEPLAYDLHSGARVDPTGAGGEWSIPRRSGCGTISGSSSCLFYRDSQPAIVDLRAGGTPRKLTRVTRPGCWISVVPACGLVLLPEASAGCVCAFPVQTSLALAPR